MKGFRSPAGRTHGGRVLIALLLNHGMAAVTAGLGRFAKRDAAGNQVTGSESDAVGLDEWDNSVAPRPVYYSSLYGGLDQAGPDDTRVKYDVAVRGTRGEVLCYQVQPDTTFTADTSDNALVRFHVWEILFDESGKITAAYRRPLLQANRITPSGGAGEIHRLGLSDDGSVPSGVFTDYLRFAPPTNAIWVLQGRQRTDVHDNAV